MKKCNYYDCNLLFSFRIQKFEDNDILIVIQSNNSIDLLLGIDHMVSFIIKSYVYCIWR